MIDEESRDRVLYEIERREAEDPNYHRPSSIPQQDASRRHMLDQADGPSGPSEYDQYSDDEFRRDLYNYYPGGDPAGSGNR